MLNPQARTLKRETRKQVCVTAFSRTLDFYGFYGYVGIWQVLYSSYK